MSSSSLHPTAIEPAGHQVTQPTETEHQPDTPSPDALFTSLEIEQFAADDAAAGQILGRILSGGFVFTIVATGAAGFWTMWHHGGESIEKFVVVPSIIVVCLCIAFGWGKAMTDYGAEHDDLE
ncbi:hypothetical protein [Fuerstiella marisgermanici]|uniref:hypothetical protein n=1 Tax=Fuerstiella marisgermanici TaxID=1891926 RepID=UPI0011AB5E75|nr:hypothetical protein [Fuerstiella marisgermanici]